MSVYRKEEYDPDRYDRERAVRALADLTGTNLDTRGGRIVGYWRREDYIDNGTIVVNEQYVALNAQAQTGVLYPNETKAYNYMWNNSFRKGEVWRENFAWLTDKGVLVLPTTSNTSSSSDAWILKTKQVKGQWYVQYNDSWLKITGSVHTHPNGLFQSYSDGDLGLLKTLSTMPHFTIGTKEVWGSTYQFSKSGNMDNTIQIMMGTQNEVLRGASLIKYIGYINSLRK